MRTTLLAVILMLGAAATASAQSSSLTALAQEAQRLAQSERRVVVSDGTFRTELPAATAPYATGGPLATIPTRPLRAGVEPTVQEFRVRSWTDGAGVQVLVFAVTVSGPTREAREEEIASVFVPLGQSVEIAATERFNARRLTLTVIDSRLTPRPPIRRVAAPPVPAVLPAIYRVETYRGDVPTDPMRRPWQPPSQ